MYLNDTLTKHFFNVTLFSDYTLFTLEFILKYIITQFHNYNNEIIIFCFKWIPTIYRQTLIRSTAECLSLRRSPHAAETVIRSRQSLRIREVSVTTFSKITILTYENPMTEEFRVTRHRF